MTQGIDGSNSYHRMFGWGYHLKQMKHNTLDEVMYQLRLLYPKTKCARNDCLSFYLWLNIDQHYVLP